MQQSINFGLLAGCLFSIASASIPNANPIPLAKCPDNCIISNLGHIENIGLTTGQNKSTAEPLLSASQATIGIKTAQLSTAKIQNAEDNAEHIVLANCQDGNGVRSSQMAYYGGAVGGNPASVAFVQANPGNTAWWEGGSPVSATFGDGNTFSANIPTVVPNGDFAGVGKNNFGLFSCWRSYVPGLYSLNGVSCYGIYDCNHRPVPVDTTEVDIHVKPGTVNLDVQYSLADIYGAVWNQRGPQDCNETPVPVGGGSRCSIVFSCHGDAPNWQATNGMAGTLANVVAGTQGMESTTTISIPQTCLKTGWIGLSEICLEWSPSTQTVSVVPHEVDIFVSNIPPPGSGRNPNQKAQLTATISCPAPESPNCAWCEGVQVALSAGSLIPDVGVAFGIGDVVATAICDLQGC